MREHPWHLPSSTAKHYQQYRNLADFHDLTLSWLKELQLPQLPHLLPRTPSKKITENLWMLDSLNDTEIDLLMDDTSPEDVLSRLEHTVWTVQAWTLINLFERTPPAELPPLRSLLEQLAWKQGRKIGESRWASLSSAQRENLKELLYSLSDSPLGMSGSDLPFLVRRMLPLEADIELYHCPHRVSYPEVKPVADELCRLHIQWVRGFVYALNSRVLIEDTKCEPRCCLHWTMKGQSNQ